MTDADEISEEVEENEETEEEQPDAEDPNEGLKKAIKAERAARRKAEREAREATEALALKDKPADEQAIDQARREGRSEGVAGLAGKLVRSEVKAALAGKVTDPSRVLRLIDVSDIEVSDDGDVDEAAVADAIDAFLEEFPEFKPTRNAGSADQFTKGRISKEEKPNPNDLIRAAFQKN